MIINLLFAINDHYLQHLKTTLWSIHCNTKPNIEYHIYVLQQPLLQRNLELKKFCQQLHMQYYPIIINDPEFFAEAPVSKRYPLTIYYRLLAHHYLPTHLQRILYMDADILCINDFSQLYQLDLENNYYAAAIHSGLTDLTNVFNKMRLDTYESDGYYNSGLLLMNLPLIRQHVHAEEIFQTIKNFGKFFLLPDQDILNTLYSKHILSIPDEIYNYDTRKKLIYETTSGGQFNLNWTIENTVFLHYCGKDKPWQLSYKGNFRELYLHYQHQMLNLTTY
ncbi:glycosyltransferase family 8 protein [Lactobacillus bombi]|nr:glycosyltransferase family 8 protein [Bombilactobacillus bombi]